MKQTAIGITVLLSGGAAILAANAFLGADEPAPAAPVPLAMTDGVVLDSAGQTNGQTAERTPAATVDRGMTEAMVDELIARGFIPAEYRELWLDPNYDEIAEKRFNVIPKTGREPGETCEPLGVEGSHLCWNDYGYHPYLAYDIEQLKSMATTDAMAAEAVAMRLPAEATRERLEYAMLASRLSGKSGPIMRHVYLYDPHQQDPHYFEKSLDRFALALFGERMGYPYRFSVELEAKIRKDFSLTRNDLREALKQRRAELFAAWEAES